MRGRGVPDTAAALSADAGMAVFKVAFERWVDPTNQQDFPQLVREVFEELRGVLAPP